MKSNFDKQYQFMGQIGMTANSVVVLVKKKNKKKKNKENQMSNQAHDDTSNY